MSIIRVSSGETVSGAQVPDGEVLRVLSGGAAVGTTVFSGGELSPAPGGVIENVDVRSRGFVVGGGQLAGSSTVEGGSVADVTLVGSLTVSRGRTKDVTVLNGGVEFIDAGAVMSGGTVGQGGLVILAGRHAGSGEILSGGTLQLGTRGNGLVVENGGTLEFEGQIAKRVVYSGIKVDHATLLDGVTLSSGARLILDNATVVSGGVLSLTALAPVISSIVVAGGKLVGPGQVDTVDVGGGSVSGLNVVGRLTIGGGATGHGDIIGKGAVEVVSNGLVRGETVLRFGELDLVDDAFPDQSFGGRAGGIVVEGGRLVISGAFARASGTVLSSGARELVTFVGQDFGTRILAGAVEVISGGAQVASAISSLISSGGLEIVSDRQAVTVGATVFAGGVLSVTRQAGVFGGLTLAGGTAIISGTVSGGQTVSFGASGTLELGNLSGFHAAISGMSTSAQKVDLDGFAFSTSESVAWTQSGTSGTLTVTDGAKVATLTLIGSYTTSDFKLADDGHGGTFVFDPRATPHAPAAAQLVQAAAGLHGGRSGADIAVANGGGVVAHAQPLAAAISGR